MSVYNSRAQISCGQIFMQKEENVLQWSYTDVESASVRYFMLAKHLLVPQNGQETRYPKIGMDGCYVQIYCTLNCNAAADCRGQKAAVTSKGKNHNPVGLQNGNTLASRINGANL